MTLKEKFKERLYNQSHDDSECLRIRFENIDKVIDSQEKIADQFAIGFSLWKEANVVQDDNDMYFNESRIQVSRNNPVDIHQLLKIYKKEKGL
jgi:hypothetical protein